MKRRLSILCQVYLWLVLAVVTLLSPLPGSPVALALLGASLITSLRPLPPGVKVAGALATLSLLPVLLAPVLSLLFPNLTAVSSALAAVLLSLPGSYLLDERLRQLAPSLAPEAKPEGKHLTRVSRVLLVWAAVSLLVALLFNSLPLLFSSLLLLAYLASLIIWLNAVLPRKVLALPVLTRRIVAGNTKEVPLHLTSSSSAQLYTYLRALPPWAALKPDRLVLDRQKVPFRLTVTPPLAGPSRVSLAASSLDPRGILQIDQLVPAADLHIIPRARYAQWLAERYLEQTAGEGLAFHPLVAALLPLRGLEYYQSRDYQPGDPLKNLDWKHTLKLGRLVIKDYLEAGGQAALLAVNLTVGSAEEADELAFYLITSALTLAGEGIPAAIAAYDHRRLALATGLTSPRAVLRKTLSLVKDISITELPRRRLTVPDPGRLRRNISQLGAVNSPPASALRGLLQLEYQAMEKGMKEHPLTLALQASTRHLPLPAMLVLVSLLNHDGEAVALNAERLSKRNFTLLPVIPDKSKGKARGALLSRSP
ncbi:MAG: DUF58 domain-containing protein [Chloroflexota bacterium]